MSPEVLVENCKKNKLYVTPELNDVMYLHFHGFTKIENLEKYRGLKCLWLESNILSKIEGLENQTNLRSLYLQHNMINKIEGLESCRQLDTLVLSHNCLKKIENCHSVVLPLLNTLNVSHNYLQSSEDIQLLKQCLNLSVLDISHNQLDDILVLKIFSEMPSLHVLTMTGNPVISMIPNYRKTMILECKNLTYLDTRPVFPRDRFCAEAWKRGGHVEERKAHEKWNRDERRKIRKSLNATLALRKDSEGNPVALIPSSDEEDDQPANGKCGKSVKMDAMDVYEDQEKNLKTLQREQEAELMFLTHKSPITNAADIFRGGEPYFEKEDDSDEKPSNPMDELGKFENFVGPDHTAEDLVKSGENENKEDTLTLLSNICRNPQKTDATPEDNEKFSIFKLGSPNKQPSQPVVKKPLIEIIEIAEKPEKPEKLFPINERCRSFPISQKSFETPAEEKKNPLIEMIEKKRSTTPSPTRLKSTVLKSPLKDSTAEPNTEIPAKSESSENSKTNRLIKFLDVQFDSGDAGSSFEDASSEDGPPSIVSKTPLIEVIENNYVVPKKPEDLIKNIIDSISADENQEAKKDQKIEEKYPANVMYEEIVRQDSIVCSIQGDYANEETAFVIEDSVTLIVPEDSIDNYLDGSQNAAKPVIEFKLGKLESPPEQPPKEMAIENFESLAWFEEGEPTSLMFPSLKYPSILNEDPEIVEIQKRDKDLEKVLDLCQEQKKEAMQLFFMNENEQLMQLYDEAADKNLIDRIGDSDIVRVQRMCEEEDFGNSN